MKTIKKILIVFFLICFFQNSYATIGNDKTLFVDNFGTSILNIDENADGIFEREEALLEYAKNNGYTVLILRKLSNAKRTGSFYILPDDSVYTNSRDTVLENHLARFIHKAKTAPYSIAHIASGALPYYKPSGITVYKNVRHFSNINNFNHRVLQLFGNNSYCFDMIMGEQDYWINGNPDVKDTNWIRFYLPGLKYMYNTIKATSNLTGYNPLIISTYIGNLTKVISFSAQAQADSIDKYTDWVYMDFYFDGSKINQRHSSGGMQYEFFHRDSILGTRMLKFANNSFPTYILPLFNYQASADVNSNFFGDNLVNNNGLFFNQDNSVWHGTINSVKDIFDSIYTNSPDPYGTGSTFTMYQLTEANPTTPNLMTKGVGWFKYSAAPESGYLLHMGDTVGSDTATTFTIKTDELITSGSDSCINCDSINGSKNSVHGHIIARNWYMNGDSIPFEHKDSLQVNLIAGDTVVYTYEITVYDPANTGVFNKLKFRKDTKLRKTLVVGNGCGWGPHWTVTSSVNPTCPNYNNGTITLDYVCSSCSPSNKTFKWYNASNTLILSQNSTTATGLSAGKYRVEIYCGTTYLSHTYVVLHAVDNSPHPTIFSDNDEINCYGSMHINNAYSSYSKQWYRNGTGTGNAISGETLLSYTATQSGTYYVKVWQTGGCAGFSAPLVINYAPTPTINGSDITCLTAGETVKTYTVTPETNNSSYSWSIPSGSGLLYSADGNTLIVNSWGIFATTGTTISCTVTNACGRSATAILIVKGCCTTASVWDMNNQSINSGTPIILTGTFNINGVLNISGASTEVTINGADVKLSKESKIVVGNGAKLFITGNSYLRSCGNDMWTGIEIQGNGIVELNTKSKIEDAKIAINALSNGVIRIDDATLNANYEHVKINGNGGANSSYIRNGAILTCTASGIYSNCLKAPYTGLRTYRGVDLQNIGAITIGNSAGNRVEINYIDVGIYSQGSYTTVSYVDFSANGSGNFSQIGGTLTSFENHFNGCLVGVKGTDNSNMFVHNNNFQSCNKGVYIYRNRNSEFHIYRNTINNCAGYGIQHVANMRCLHEIYSNIITYDREAYPFGIEVIGLIGEGDANAGSTTNIFDNELYNIPFGIHLQSMDEANIYSNLHNEVMSTPNSDYTSYGIKVENCNRTSIEGNSVSSFGNSLQQVWWSNGIMADNSPGTELTCNSVGNIGRGLWIGGQSPNTKLAGNAMGNCYDQVYLNWNLMGLGDQGQDISINPPNGLAFDNEWVGTVYTAGNGHQTNSYYSNYGKIGGYTMFHTRSGGVYEPTDNYVNDPSNYDICNTDVLYNFNGDTYCRERPVLPKEREVEKRVALDNYNFDSYFETFNWMSKEYLLKQSKADATLAANDITIANAVLQLEQSNVGTINAIKDSISNTDSLSMAEILQLQQLNSGVQATKAVEANYKTANNLSLNFEKTGAFTNGQKNTIVYLSNLCPYAAGPAVYMARTLRALYDTVPHQYNSCSFYNPTPANRKANGAIEKFGIITTKLFPSPSDGNAIYEFAIDEKATAKIKIFDFTGKLILSKDVSGTNKYEFKKLNLSEGVYRVQLTVNGELSDEQNMVVVK